MNPNNHPDNINRTSNNSWAPTGTNDAAHPAGATGSITDTLKGYVGVAMAKGQEALEQAKVLGHKAQEQLNHAMATDQTHDPNQSHYNQQSQQNSTTMSGHLNSGNPTSGNHVGGNLHSNANADAFGDVNQFNANAAKPAGYNAGHNAAGNLGSKTSQGGI
ncbi:hypothetical protein BGZ70_007261 [Mortierella alpina]|uniref:Uncharacterized protein n=1 Tax=Mortierella alpina TaxID=64518 RepID=A0A9P6J8L4_MORAP|nr:hypothetical protein BGZ70_007261 [Mortierella alpina]